MSAAAALIERLHRLPDEGRSFRCDERFAELHFGFGAAALDELIAQGLPHAGAGRARRFEYGDLHYLGLRLGTARTYLWGLARWAQALERFAGRARTAVRIDFVPQLAPDAGRPAAVLRLPDGSRREVVLEGGRSVGQARGVLLGEWPALPPAAAAVVGEVAAAVDFYLLSPHLRRDTSRVAESGLADCLTVAPLIVERWRAAGLDARVSEGLLVAQPYSTVHSWPEVRVGETWVPVDPLTVELMTSFGGLDPERWPPHRSSGPMLLAVEEPGALIATGSGVVATTFMTRIEEDPAG